MSKFIFIFSFLSIMSGFGSGQKAVAQTVNFSADATNKGQLVYQEKHKSVYSASKVIESSITEYFSPEGKKIAEISSDFKTSIAAPLHVFKDLRFDHTHGLRLNKENKLEMFAINGTEAENTKLVSVPKGETQLMVGCQGLYFFLQAKYDDVKKRKKIPLLFLIPGDLDVYNFELEWLREEGNLAYMEIHIKNRILRLFAPKLKVVYDIEKKQMVSYEGLSNLWNEKKKNQSVRIDYKY
jgi:hypothetical protein